MRLYKEYLDSNKKTAAHIFKRQFYNFIKDVPYNKDIVIICIGSDKSTGDSLAPLVGYMLKNMRFDNTYVYGSLNDTIHANNLKVKVDEIYNKHKDPFVIAIDASIGSYRIVGHILVKSGALEPGAGVGKSLPRVGDISITGVVCEHNEFSSLNLGWVSLYIVMRMAEVISKGIKSGLKMYGKNRDS